MIIQEADIIQALEMFDRPGTGEQWLERFQIDQEDFHHYLDQEVFKVLNEAERDLCLFILSVIFYILTQKNLPVTFDLQAFFDQEEKNWNLYEQGIRDPFRERIDPFFELSDEEEALAFIEDALLEDEDEAETQTPITHVGRDIIWNVCAAFVIQAKK